jgi:starvation-inducible DNA-binding protein
VVRNHQAKNKGNAMNKKLAVLKTKAHVDSMNTGLDEKYRNAMSQALTGILSDTYRLLIKTHIYHWNVMGPLFKPLHELTEEHYGALLGAADIIAERIRALGHLAPAELAGTSQFAPKGASVDKLTAEAMVTDLIAEHEAAVRSMRKAADDAETGKDFVTTDMLTERMTFHEKALWMLRAHIA